MGSNGVPATGRYCEGDSWRAGGPRVARAGLGLEVAEAAVLARGLAVVA